MDGELMGRPLTGGLFISKSIKATRLGRQLFLYSPITIAERFWFVHIQPKTRELDAERSPVA
jgi:hypothetical protein